jgi:hypothetical protein
MKKYITISLSIILPSIITFIVFLASNDRYRNMRNFWKNEVRYKAPNYMLTSEYVNCLEGADDVVVVQYKSAGDEFVRFPFIPEVN